MTNFSLQVLNPLGSYTRVFTVCQLVNFWFYALKFAEVMIILPRILGEGIT